MNTSATQSSMQNVPEWRKRANEIPESAWAVKRPRYEYYYVLESEPSSESERSESIYSVQDKETDYPKDTSDTDTKSSYMSDNDDGSNVEFEIVSSIESDLNPAALSSSSDDDYLLAAGAATLVVSLVDSDLTSDDDDDDDNCSVISQIRSNLSRFNLCRMCEKHKTTSGYTFCTYCFQEKKRCNPPRPKPNKKRAPKPCTMKTPKNNKPVTKLNLNNCLNNLSQSQDSGMDSMATSSSISQELETMAWNKVIVPTKLIPWTLSTPGPSSSGNAALTSSMESLFGEATEPEDIKEVTRIGHGNVKPVTSCRNFMKKPKEIVVEKIEPVAGCSHFMTKSEEIKPIKRTFNDNIEPVAGCSNKIKLIKGAGIDNIEPVAGCSNKIELIKRTFNDNIEPVAGCSNFMIKSEEIKLVEKTGNDLIDDNVELVANGNNFMAAHPSRDSFIAAAQDMCILCNTLPKTGLFIHTNSAHQCCCYHCAVKFWSKAKRCAWCNLKAKNVIKSYLVG